MTGEKRSLSAEVVVEGTPTEVWRAVATGPGISSWYVPHTIEEHAGGGATARFGAGPEMEIPGRVALWDPPKRVVFDGGADVDGFDFDWTITPNGDGTCTVKLVQGGFGGSADWEGAYEGMTVGWKMFLSNLQLHCRHFAGRSATAALPTVSWTGAKDSIWTALTDGLGIPSAPTVGDRCDLRAGADLALVGEVVEVLPTRISLLVDEPAPGTAFVAVEGADGAEEFSVSVWSYLYGDEGRAVVERDEARWQAWLDGLSAPDH